jgi:hypothetical protein
VYGSLKRNDSTDTDKELANLIENNSKEDKYLDNRMKKWERMLMYNTYKLFRLLYTSLYFYLFPLFVISAAMFNIFIGTNECK